MWGRGRGTGTSEDGVQGQEISPDGRAHHGEGEEEEFEDYGAERGGAVRIARGVGGRWGWKVMSGGVRGSESGKAKGAYAGTAGAMLLFWEGWEGASSLSRRVFSEERMRRDVIVGG